MIKNYFEKALTKGEYAESIVREYLEKTGWVVYFPFTKNRAHAFDMLATKNKDKVMAADVKAKARMNLRPFRTGINTKTVTEYSNFTSRCSVPFKLFFVDEHPDEMRVYGNDLAVLGEPDYNYSGISLWKLDRMIPLFKLTQEQCEKLMAFSHRNYEYA